MNRDVHHLSSSEIAGLPGMPATAHGVRIRAKRLRWPSRNRAGRGGGLEYPVTCLPARAQASIARRDRRGARGILIAAAVEKLLPKLRRSIEQAVTKAVARAARRIAL